MEAITTPRHCAYPGCDQSPAAPGSDRGAKPKYCDDPGHNPLSGHRERRRKEAEASGQRAEETGGQPVTFGITRAAELISTLEKLTAQHADTLTRAIAELRAAGDLESAEAEVYAARTTADQRIATTEAHLAEEVQRRMTAETERGTARAHRDQADEAAAAAITRMDQLERELADLRAATEAEIRDIRDSSAADIEHAHDQAQAAIDAARGHAAHQIADAQARARQAERDAALARQAEAAAVAQAEHARSTATDETARIRTDHQRALDQLTTATSARITALEETRDAFRSRAQRAEADLDAARIQHQRLAKQLAEATAPKPDSTADDIPAARPGPGRPRKGTPKQTPRAEVE